MSPSTPPESKSELIPAANSSAKIDMVFRFWTPALSEQREKSAQMVSAQHAGVLALIEDAAAAKRGVLAANHDQVIVSGFTHPADALVISRQIQYGLQGFRGKAGTAPVAVSIVIDFKGRTASVESTGQESGAGRRDGDKSSIEKKSRGPEISHELTTLLSIAKPAQVLLTHDLLQQISAIKGLPLKTFPGRFGVYEYLWTATDRLDLLQSEPQLTLAAVPAAPAAVRATMEQKELPRQVVAADAERVVPSKPERELRSTEHFPEEPQQRRPLILAGIAIAAVLVIAVIGFTVFRGPSSPAANATSPATTTATSPGGVGPATKAPAMRPAASTPVLSKSKAPAPTAAKNSRQKPEEQAPTPVAETKPAPPPQPAASQPCTIPGDIGKYASLAESYRARGDYTDAIRIFRQVLSCDPSNAVARDGLSRALQAQQQSK